MADRISPEQRSKIMSAIRSKNTKLELRIRKMVFAMGYRYRLHRKDLPGSPDLAFISKKKALFVHGCYWHQHEDPRCKISSRPKTQSPFWIQKFARNKARDVKNERALCKMGWKVLTIWECQNDEEVMGRLEKFLG